MAARDLTGTTVLVVDDDEDSMDFVRAPARAGRRGVPARDHMLDALATFDRLTPRVVLTDLAMPGGSGLDLLVALRERRPPVPVVAVTAQLLPANDLLIARGLSAVVFKPVDAGELLAVVWHLARATRGLT